MRRFLFLVISMVLFLASFAKEIDIKATVLDQATNEPLSFVGVMLLKGEVLIKGNMANEEGQFLLENVTPGEYNLKISFVGYKTYEKSLRLTGKQLSVNLGQIYMQEDATLLNEVEVIAQGSQMKFDVDKKVFSVDQNISSAGGSVTQVLENVPSVEVDVEGNISLRNSTNVEVWINGKPAGLTEENRSQILEQMPAGSLESVELITNPSAKYSPEGISGIINLVLKKNRKAGYFGNVNAGFIVPANTKLGQLGGLNLNFNKGKVDAYLNVGMRNWWHTHKGITDRYYFSGQDTTSSLFQDKSYLHIRKGSTARFGLNYHINDKHTLGLSGFGLLGQGSNDEQVRYELRDSLNNTTSIYTRDIYEPGYRNTGNATLDYTWSIDKKGSELLSSLSYSYFEIGRDASYLQTIESGTGSPLDQIQNLDAHNNAIQFKTDLIKRFSKDNKFETGVDIKRQARYSYSDGANFDGSQYLDVPTMYNTFDYIEDIYASYVTYAMKINKFRFMGGLRGEYTNIETKTKSASDNSSSTTNDFQLYPSAFIAYNLTSKDEFQINYTRRVKRPRGRRLNSFHDYSDSTNISYGNPYLEPEFSSSFELNYLKTYGSRGQHMLSSSIYSHFVDNSIERVRFINDDGLLNTTYMNVTQSQSSGLELISKNSIGKFLNFTATFNMFYYYIKPTAFVVSPTQTIDIEGEESFSWKTKILSNIMLSKNSSAQLSWQYRSPRAVPQGIIKGRNRIDLGLRQSFLKKALVATISVRDVFNMNKRISETFDADFYQYEVYTFEGPQTTITLTYNFGNSDKKNKINKVEENEMEEF